MTQIASLLAVATVFISSILQSGRGAYTRDKTELELKMQGGA